MNETEEERSQSWGEVYEEQAAAEEAALGFVCHSCRESVDYIGEQADDRWYRCSQCEREQTLAELAHGPQPCDSCHGTGLQTFARYGIEYRCSGCEGTGRR